MRKIKVLDKDLNTKWYIDDIDGEVSFSITENGFWPLDFSIVGDYDIEHSDLVKVIDTEGQTVEEIVTNDDYLRFDGTNDYVQTGTSVARRARIFNHTGLTPSSDWSGDYLTNFGWSTPDYRYVDIGGTFDEIDQSNSFSIKFVVELSWGTHTIFQHNDLIINVQSSEVRIWRIWWVGVSFAYSAGTYYRLVIVRNWSAFTAYVNSTPIAGTNAPTGLVRPYCVIWANASAGSATSTTTKWYLLCVRDRVLTGWEITAENASHAPVTASNRFYNVNASWLVAVDNIITSGVVSWDLTASTNICISWRFRLDKDGADNAFSQCIVLTPYVYIHARWSTNSLQFRYDNAGARLSSYVLGNGDRARHHFVWVAQYTWSTRQTKLRVDGTLRDSDDHAVAPSTNYADYIELGRRDTTYYDGDIKDIRVHTYTGEITDDDALRLYQWLDPQDTPDVVQYARYDMNEWTGTVIEDNATIYWASRQTSTTASFVKTHNRVIEAEIYYGQVVKITPTIQARSGKRTRVNCLGIQTVLNDRFFRGPDGTTDRTGEWWVGNYYPFHILQYVYDQAEYKYIDYTWEDKLIYKDWLRDRSRNRYWGYVLPGSSVIDPFGNTVELYTRTSSDGNLEVEQMLTASPDNVQYICSVWLKTDSGTKTVIFSYWSIGGSYFAIRTYTIDTTWRRYSVRHSRSDGWGGIKFRIQVDGNVYISNPVVYRWSETNLEDFGDLMEINYDSTKLLRARQDAIEYSGAKIRRTTDMYPIAFEPDIGNTPDHYLIEEKHLSFLEKWVYSDEIVNSVQVERATDITDPITDTTSIDDYREREAIISATNLNNETSAINYGNVFLEKNKDPKNYIKAVVTRDYPLHSLRVGDLVQINGNTLEIDRGYITRLDMNDKQCTLYLDHYDGLEKSLSKLS